MEVRGEELLRAEGSVLVGPGNQTQVVMLASKCLYPLSTLPAQENIFFNDLFDLKFCAHELRDQKRVSDPWN